MAASHLRGASAHAVRFQDGDGGGVHSKQLAEYAPIVFAQALRYAVRCRRTSANVCVLRMMRPKSNPNPFAPLR